jgi:hypothetical protein
MTEAEASEKWCPMARVDGCFESYPAFNRVKDDSSPNEACCIASDCMMWRWEYQATQNLTAPMQPVMHPTGETWVCDECKGGGKMPITAVDLVYAPDLTIGEMTPCPECEGKGKGFKYAPSGYCGLAGPLR